MVNQQAWEVWHTADKRLVATEMNTVRENAFLSRKHIRHDITKHGTRYHFFTFNPNITKVELMWFIFCLEEGRVNVQKVNLVSLGDAVRAVRCSKCNQIFHTYDSKATRCQGCKK